MNGASMVLMMDDASEVRRHVAAMLARIDGIHRVLEAEDTPTAVALFAQFQPRLAILDINVPGGKGLKNGIDVVSVIKQTEPATSVIILTNHVEVHYQRACRRAGADLFLDKSSEFDQLAEAVALMLHQRG
jgi:DNA-binding NarL/FixJ family response regulator